MIKLYFNLIILGSILSIMASNDEICSKFVQASLKYQIGLAYEVKSKLGKDHVYVYDYSGVFAGATKTSLDGIHYNISKNGDVGLLSESAQSAFGNNPNNYKSYTDLPLIDNGLGLLV